MTPAEEFNLRKAGYTITEILGILPWGRTTIYEFIKRGDLRVTKLGKKTWVCAIDLAALMRKLRDDPTFYRDRTQTTRESATRLRRAHQIDEAERAQRKARALEVRRLRKAAAEEFLKDVGL